MRLLVAGSSAFAVPTLDAVVAAGHAVVGVLTAPDRAGTRGRPAPRPLRDRARALQLPLWQPETLRDPALLAALLASGADGIVVASYGRLIPAALLAALPLGGLNVHPSLLPRHRGAAPVAAAILAGDPVTGVSVMQMAASLDTGPVHAAITWPVAPTATTPELTAELAEAGARLLVQVLAQAAAGTAQPRPQDPGRATYTPRLDRHTGELDWSRPAVVIDRHVRALQPWPGTTLPLGGQRVKVLAGDPLPDEPAGSAAPGRVRTIEGAAAVVQTGEGWYRCRRVQPPSRPAMDAAAYLRGRRDAATTPPALDSFP
ncbi:MAG TPA: methionyl-tRNA formyltransferase [Candidatus Dormibacteraeota bacterium]|nr:methionyl-tRNA formyltransferase [Candidatus Dormibacteraeota bacterium]